MFEPLSSPDIKVLCILDFFCFGNRGHFWSCLSFPLIWSIMQKARLQYDELFSFIASHTPHYYQKKGPLRYAYCFFCQCAP
jgi:hypothetical protein